MPLQSAVVRLASSRHLEFVFIRTQASHDPEESWPDLKQKFPSVNDRQDDENAKRYFELQNGDLDFKEQFNTRAQPEELRALFQTKHQVHKILQRQRQHSPLPLTPST